MHFLEALEATLGGFSEGGYTGDHATDAPAGIVHGQEFVVNAADAERYGLRGKRGSEFGDAMSDYFADRTPALMNTYTAQRNDFEKAVNRSDSNSNFIRLEKQVVEMTKAIKKMPNNSIDYNWLTDFILETTERTVRNKMTKTNKRRKRL